ncbi:RNA polymerase sigma factor [Bordetella sp. N]|uniref:RNA polymerase sigma factor n=1 Tax=Bordetella sp. N TaxID=1746199 RepID=UPI00070F0C99|nr:sigma-70 family RNA polymerase sigma factor [Bordetella sp. N]ALM84376.1 hypothetical protein ASB57_16615 [Bordetella sp. N]
MRVSQPSSLTWLGLSLDWVYSDLLRAILRRTGSAQHAKDVLHDALVRFAVLMARPRSAPQKIDEPHAYVRRIVDSVLVDQFRNESRYVPLPNDGDAMERALHGMHGAAPSSELLADLRQRLVAVQDVIESLPPRCREVFWLLRVEGLTYPEISTRLNIALKTVEGHAVKGLARVSMLRQLLA